MNRDSTLERRALLIMEEVMDLPADEQAQALERHCQGDAQLKQRVMALLASDHDETIGLANELTRGAQLPLPESVGPYRLLGRLGEGGMGAVYLARRADGAYERQVAVKFVRAGHRAAAQQFAVERQILAGLKHPNIAQLLDGGEVNGQPYLVMEYIEGAPISECVAHPDVTLKDALRLFIQVANAVHYAHGRLIVHRDIKPSNVLVTKDRQVKLLDFGIAKLYQTPGQTPGVDAAQSALTSAGLTPITPDYASPEQLAGEPATPASDVYALGVLMYESLTGERPYKLAGRSLPEAHRVLRETGEQPPSLATGSHSRSSPPQTLPSFSAVQLRGDLDRIVMKAMHRDPARRYASAAHIADDLQRLLDGKPVLAHGDDWWYLTRKFIARHRTGIIAAAVGVAMLIAGLIVTSTLYVEAERARTQADLRFTQLRELARSMMFGVYDEIDKIPGSTSARQMLVADVQTYLEALSLSPDAPVDVQLDAARGYVRLYEIFNRQAADPEDRNKAQAAADKAQSLLEQLISTAPETAAAYRTLGDLLSAQADETLYTSNRPEEAREQLQRALEAYAQAAQRAPEDLDLAAKRLRAQRILADTYKWQNNFEQAVQNLTGLLGQIETLRADAPDHPALMRVYADAWFLRGESYYFDGDAAPAEGDFQQALLWYRKLLEISEEKRSINDALMIAHWSLGNLQYENETWQPALDNYDAALNLLQPQIARDPNDVNTIRRLRIVSATQSKALSQVGRVDEALRIAAEGNRWFEQRALADPDTPVALREVALSYDTTADVLDIGGRARDACEWRQRTLEVWQRIDAKWGIAEFDKQEPDRVKGLMGACR